ncbi:MAG: adenine phosphoribosyltransferase [Defluviitaleaceae bacterium]|nr:adenine phosphoribosyltransferase [Defluviitaleaceae bacterium]
MIDLKNIIRNFPNFPKEGIIFRDIMPILANPPYFQHAIEQIEKTLEDVDYDIIIAPESRGFIFAAPIALRQSKPLVLARKKGKLPGDVEKQAYSLEYGEDYIEMQKDAIKPNQKIVIIDDLLATGGTVGCICKMVEYLGGQVSALAFLIELEGLGGKEVLNKYNIHSIIKY